MKKLLVSLSLVFVISIAYCQKAKYTPSAISTISNEDLEQIPSGSFLETLRSLKPTVSVGPSWSTGKDSGPDWEYKFTPGLEIVAGAYRDFIFNKNFNSKIRTRAGLRFRFGGTSEKWMVSGSLEDYEGKRKINWGYIEVPAEIDYKFNVFGKRGYAGFGLTPAFKLYANWKEEDRDKEKLEDFKGFNLFISPRVGIQLCDCGELDLSYDFGVISWGGSGEDKAHHVNSVSIRYIHKFY